MEKQWIMKLPNPLIALRVEGEEVYVEAFSTEAVRVMGEIEHQNADIPNRKMTQKLHWTYYDLKNNTYRSFFCTGFWESRQEIRIDSQIEEYQRMLSFVTRQYMEYVNSKLYKDEQEYSADWTAFCEEEGEIFPKNYGDLILDYRKNHKMTEVVKKSLSVNLEYGVLFQEPKQYEWLLGKMQYLSKDSNNNEVKKQPDEKFWKDEIKIPYFNQVRRLYIGNRYCMHLYPEAEILEQIISYGVKASYEITMVFSPMAQWQRTVFFDRLEALERLAEKYDISIEVEGNDWGLLSHMQNKGYNRLVSVAGIHLAKKRKDPRYFLKPSFQRAVQNTDSEIGNHETELEKSDFKNENREIKLESAVKDYNQLKELHTCDFIKGQPGNEFYLEFLQKLDIDRISLEACGYEIAPPEKLAITLFYPVYQTNTSSFCPLRAMCEKGSRGKQAADVSCRKYCEDYVAVYPNYTNSFLQYNSIFSLDTYLDIHPENFDKLEGNGNRFVFVIF